VRYLLDPPLVVYALALLLALGVLWFRLERGQFFALVVSAALSIATAEVLCRSNGWGNPAVAVWEQEQSQGTVYAYPPYARLVYRYPDNPRGYFDEDNEVHASINSKGFRGPERAFEAPPGTARIAFLGDSFTLGIGVRDEHTLPASFERALRTRHPDAEVLNFGVSGSSTGDQIEMLEKYVLSFHPDAVVLVLFLNDADRLGTIRYMSRGRLFRELRAHSWFVNALVGGAEKRLLHRKMVTHFLDGYVEGRPGWEAMKAEIERGWVLSEARGFRLVVALYPVLVHLDERYPFTAIHDTVGHYCRSIGVPFVDLFPAFLGKEDVALWVHATDQHPNEVAHRLAGELLAKRFDREQLFRRRLGGSGGSQLVPPR
jgi:lysophospholipase L1-like esterase